MVFDAVRHAGAGAGGIGQTSMVAEDGIGKNLGSQSLISSCPIHEKLSTGSRMIDSDGFALENSIEVGVMLAEVVKFSGEAGRRGQAKHARGRSREFGSLIEVLGKRLPITSVGRLARMCKRLERFGSVNV